MDELPFSQACENNKPYILDVLREVFADREKVLEIGTGTGQHACFFAQHLPWLNWQPSDIAEHLPLSRQRIANHEGDNLLPVLALDVRDLPWPLAIPEAVFTANTFHIMAFSAVRQLFAALAAGAPRDLVLAVYGPFNYNGEYTSPSNAQFDRWLSQRDPDSAIRDFTAVDELAAAAGFRLQRDCEMPANNRLLVWRRAGNAADQE